MNRLYIVSAWLTQQRRTLRLMISAQSSIAAIRNANRLFNRDKTARAVDCPAIAYAAEAAKLKLASAKAWLAENPPTNPPTIGALCDQWPRVEAYE